MSHEDQDSNFLDDDDESTTPLILRVKRLEQLLLDGNSECCLEGLLDVVVAVAEDTRGLALTKSNRLFNNIHEKFKSPAKWISSHRLHLNDFECIKRIGKGAFGEVQLVRHSNTRQVFALKILSKAKVLEQPGSAFYWEEREIMAKANSNWIVKLHYAIQDVDNLYMIMEYVPGGNLNQWIEDLREEMSEKDAIFYIAETILALEVLHNLNFIHRDIKPSNLLLDRNGHVKLADFGTAIHMDPITHKATTSTAVGTPDYLSPEVLLCQSKDNASIGPEVDWWAVGIMIYELIFIDPPFYTESLMQTYNMIMNHKQHLRFPDHFDVPAETIHLIKSLISDADVRLGRNGAHEIKNHSCFQLRSWTWDNIQDHPPPFVPQLHGETDTSRFDMDKDDTSDSDSKVKQLDSDLDEIKKINSSKIKSSIKPFTGEQLSFAGFTFIDSQFSLFHVGDEISSSTAPPTRTLSHRSDSGVHLFDRSFAQWEAERKKLLETIDNLENQLIEVNNNQQVTSKERQSLLAVKVKLECENGQFQQDLDNLLHTNQEIIEKQNELNEKFDKNQHEMKELNSEKLLLENKLHNVKNQLNELQKNFDDKKIENEELVEDNLILAKERDHLQLELEKQRMFNVEIEMQLSDKQCELAALQTNYERTKQQQLGDFGEKEQFDEHLLIERNLREELEIQKLDLEKLCQRLELDLIRAQQNMNDLRTKEEQTRKETERQQRQLDKQLRTLQSDNAALNRRCEHLQETLDSEDHFKELYRTQMEEREEQCKELMETMDSVTNEEKRLKKEIETNRLTIRQLNEQIVNFQEQMLIEAEEHKRIQRQQTDTQKREFKLLEDNLMEQQTKLRLLQQQYNDVKAESDKKDETVNKLTKDLQLANALKEATIDKLNKKLNLPSGKGSVFPFRQDANVNTAKIKSLQSDNKKLQSRLDNLVKEHNQRIEEMNETLTTLLQDRDDVQKQLETAIQQNEELRRTNAYLQQQPFSYARNSMTEMTMTQFNVDYNPVFDTMDNISTTSTIAAGGGGVGPGGGIPSTPLPLNTPSSTMTTKQQQEAVKRGGLSSSTATLHVTAMEDDVENMEGALDMVVNPSGAEETGKKKRRKLNWESRYVRIVASRNELAIHENGSSTKPLMTINLDQVMHVRCASQADVLHEKKEVVCRLFQLIVDLEDNNNPLHNNNNINIINTSDDLFTNNLSNSLSGSLMSIETIGGSSGGSGGGNVPPITSSSAAATPINPTSISSLFSFSTSKRGTIDSRAMQQQQQHDSDAASLARRLSISTCTYSTGQPGPNGIDYSFKNHKFQDMVFRTRTYCQICHQNLGSLLSHTHSLECQRCHMKICANHVKAGAKITAVPPCGSNVRVYLLRAPSARLCERWVGALSLWIKRKLEMSTLVGGGGGGGGLLSRGSTLLTSSHHLPFTPRSATMTPIGSIAKASRGIHPMSSVDEVEDENNRNNGKRSYARNPSPSSISSSSTVESKHGSSKGGISLFSRPPVPISWRLQTGSQSGVKSTSSTESSSIAGSISKRLRSPSKS